MFVTFKQPKSKLTLLSASATLAVNTNDFLSNSFSGKSSNGLSFSVNIPPTEGDITLPFVFQNNPPAQTNFAPSESLLFTGFSPTVIPTGNSNPLTIVFNRNVKAAGAQIAASGSENIDYEVSISAFDDRNNLLGTFSRQGVSSGAITAGLLNNPDMAVPAVVYNYTIFAGRKFSQSI